MVLIAGDAKFEKDKDGGNVIIYEGETIKIPKGKQAGITGTASAVFAFDWDGDGDLDLFVGDIGGRVHLVPNEGTAKEYAFGREIHVKAGGKEIRVNGDAGPCIADWDGDGKPDLLVGAGDGAVTFYRNSGTASKPDLAAGVILVPPGETKYGNDASTEPTRGTRSKICVADWNGDGRLDLLLGDFSTLKPKQPELTDEQKKEHEKLRKELAKLEVEYHPVVQKLDDPKTTKDEKELEKLTKELQTLLDKMQEIRKKLPVEYENHGWVWLFLRKPAVTTSGGQ
jgi:hypothetical protein